MQLLQISRFIERVADHATSIAEDVIYMVEGEIPRHSVKRAVAEAMGLQRLAAAVAPPALGLRVPLSALLHECPGERASGGAGVV